MARSLTVSQVHQIWEGIYDSLIIIADDEDENIDGGMTTQPMRWGRPPREVGDRNWYRRGWNDRYKR